MSGIKVGGVWRTPGNSFVKVGGVWRTVASVQTKVGGSWQMTTLGAPPAQPTLTKVSAGVFEVSNTDTNLTYSATLVSGGGSATQDVVNGKVRFTLTNANAAFGITAAWAPGAPTSAATNIERKAYTYHTEHQCWEVTYQGSNLHYVDDGQGGGYWSWDCPGGTGGGGQWGVNICKRTDCGDVQVKDGTPAGYTDSHGEWWRIWTP